MPTTEIAEREQAPGVSLTELFVRVGLSRSRSEARRLVQQGGPYLNEEPVADVDWLVSPEDLEDGGILLRAGKKRYHRVTCLRGQ